MRRKTNSLRQKLAKRLEQLMSEKLGVPVKIDSENIVGSVGAYRQATHDTHPWELIQPPTKGCPQWLTLSSWFTMTQCCRGRGITGLDARQKRLGDWEVYAVDPRQPSMKTFLSTLERSEEFRHENDLRWRVCVWRSKCGRLKIEYCPYWQMLRWRMFTSNGKKQKLVDLKELESALVKLKDPVYAGWLNANEAS